MLAPTTKLEAVNTMLSAIGDSPVNSLASGLVDAELAEKILDATSREVQSKGWHFNREFKFRITPTAEGLIVLPTNCLKVDGIEQTADQDLVQRGNKLYNRRSHTFAVATSVEVDMVVLLDYEELPEAARNYIMVRAARIFQNRTVGSDTLNGFEVNDENVAWVELLDMEGETADYTIFDNSSVLRVLDRNIGMSIKRG